jgi:hypothetical protein
LPGLHSSARLIGIFGIFGKFFLICQAASADNEKAKHQSEISGQKSEVG